MFALTPCLSDAYKVTWAAALPAAGGRRFTIIIFFFGELEFRGRKVRHEQTRAVGREAEFDQT